MESIRKGPDDGIYRNGAQLQALPYGRHHNHRQQRCEFRHRTRRACDHSGIIRSRQIDGAQHPGRHGHEFRRQGHHRRRRHLGLQREATDRLPAQQHRIRIPVLQSGGQPHRQGERGTRLRTRQERGRSSADAGRCGTWRPRPSWPRRKRNWPRPTRRSPPDRRNCRRHGRNWLKDRTSSPIHGTSWRTAKRSWTRRENNSKQAKPCSTKSARRSANGSRPASPANSTNKYAANTTWRSTSTTKPAPNTTDS